MTNSRSRLDALFLSIGGGSRFCLLHEPPDGRSTRGAVLYVHPFAEEMNNSRRMAAVQSRAFANAGYVVLQIDLFGCGDSSGDFGEASWQRWLDDVREGAAWLQREFSHLPILWGLRTGCLLCAQAVGSLPQPARLVLWQPVVSGAQHLQQFLRLKVANQAMGHLAQGRIRTDDLRANLTRGDSVEIAGYLLSPALASGLEEAKLDISDLLGDVAWLEVSSTPGATCAPASQHVIEKARTSLQRLEAQVVQGAAFWQVPGTEDSPKLVEATLGSVGSWEGRDVSGGQAR